jgi:hypothetical protein
MNNNWEKGSASYQMLVEKQCAFAGSFTGLRNISCAAGFALPLYPLTISLRFEFLCLHTLSFGNTNPT